MVNIQFNRPYLPDPFEKTTGQAARNITRDGKS